MERFRVITDHEKNEAYLVCYEYGCDDEFVIEWEFLSRVIEIAENHRKEKHGTR